MKISDVNLDKVSPMMKQYIEIKKTCLDSIVFFRLGDFYEMFFEDALTASKVLEIALTARDAGLEDRIPMCGIPFHASQQYASKLLNNGYKIAIVEQVSLPGEQKGIVKREVVKILTPGTYIDIDSNEYSNNFIILLDKVFDEFLLIKLDSSTGEIYINIYIEESLIPSELISLKTKEIVLGNHYTPSYINELIKIQKVIVSRFDNMSINSDYSNLVKQVQPKYHKSLYLILNYLTHTQKIVLNHFKKIVLFNNDDYLKIDSFTKKNLELIETARTNQKQGSLLWLLDNCKTAMGSRLLNRWIDKPLVNLESIMKRQNMIDLFINNYIEQETIKDCLNSVYDLERIIGKISHNSVNAKDYVNLKNSLKVIPTINSVIHSLSVKTNILSTLNSHNEFYNLLSTALIDNPPMTIKDGGIIKCGYSFELDELRKVANNSSNWLIDYEENLKNNTGIKNIKIGYNRVFGYFIEIPKSSQNLVNDSFGFVRKQTLSNAERYVTDELKVFEEKALGSSDKIVRLEYNLFLKIKEQSLMYLSSLQELADQLSNLDCLINLAEVSLKNNYTKPSFNNEYIIDIEEARHPVIEKIIETDFVHNDIKISEKNILLITGPNMSGKSTYMRELAVITIMAQIGCFVPAKKANLFIFDHIFTRIGSSDDLLNGQSTFMVEMMEANYAIKYATKNSLILFDELGRGTSTYDGLALAWSIIEYIHQKINCITLFSTHYHELIELEKTLNKLKNIHVDVSEHNDSIIFSHKVLDGGASKSYGINAAALAGIPQTIIKRSKEVLKSLEHTNHKNTVPNLFDNTFEDEVIKVKVDPIFEAIKSDLDHLDVNSITPIEALSILNNLKNKIL
ncbi:MAG: DNA mismatch repair protein MutS [Anaeroplasmataceae bacterium]